MIEGLDPIVLSKLISQHVEQVTCTECCKYYIAPETAACGHSLCHGCWKGRRTCYTCAAPINRKSLKLNIPLQTLTEHVYALGEAYEKKFNVKMDDFTLGIPDDLQSGDPTRIVKEWLASSQNHFSGPVLSTQTSNHDLNPVELSNSKIQIHSHTKNNNSPEKVVVKIPTQDDWDKIEVLPDTDEIVKSKEHVVGPMDFENFIIDDNEYTTGNPRRSFRKRELKTANPPPRDVSVDKHSGKNSSINTDNKSFKTKQTWSNVKKMRKEFSKLNKKNKSKLNVSIEMCKKANSVANKPKPLIQLNDSEPHCVNIDDNTPDATNKDMTSQKNPKNLDQKQKSIDENTTNITVHNSIISNENEQQNEQSNKSISKSQNKECNDDMVIQLQNFQIAATMKNNNENICKSIKNTQSDYKNSIINNNESKILPMPFIKKSSLCKIPGNVNVDDHCVQITQNEVKSNNAITNTDDIEVSIKIGNTITNIVIKNNKSDVKMKVNTDREIQTSLGPYEISNKKDAITSPIQTNNVQNIELNVGERNIIEVNHQSLSAKKNTASADTATAQFEITNSVEKELSNMMECVETKNNVSKTTQDTSTSFKTVVTHKQSQVKVTVIPGNENEISEVIDDVDIFNSGSVKGSSVKLLKDAKYTASEILMPTIKSKKSHKALDKRDRVENDDVELPSSKKRKIQAYESIKHIEDGVKESASVPLEIPPRITANDSENMNYDAIMSQVFANIDADIQNTGNKNSCKATQNIRQKSIAGIDEVITVPPDVLSSPAILKQQQQSQIIHRTQYIPHKNASVTEAHHTSSHHNLFTEIVNQKHSENMFSLLEKDSEPLNVSGRNNNQLPVQVSTQQQINNLLTPGISREMAATSRESQGDNDIEMIEPVLGTPLDENDDSDKSVVEETPQKDLSVTKSKHTDVLKTASFSKPPLTRKLQPDNNTQSHADSKTSDSEILRSIINISDTSEDIKSKTKDATIIDMARKQQFLETPQTISKFVNHLTNNSTSTPIARKSLNFENDNLDDPEQTLCPTTTQEKEFLAEAFEQTPKSPINRPLALKNVSMKERKKLFVAGSCLSDVEVKNVKLLCQQRGWTYLDKYTADLTHLVVCVDEENKSQRSVKYMCALAASKWIVTYSWVQKCLESKSVVDEVPYEALDTSGEPGPRRSRTARAKVFEGISFFCMPPFSVLNLDTLKLILRTAGGRVVNGLSEITAHNCPTPGLLIAEPQHTQEDRFVYLAMEHKVVPVNYEWVLHCLGIYSLDSIHDLLLCPSSLLPPETAKWPAVLVMQDDYD